jgi:enediyne biosynthesis protein E4
MRTYHTIVVILISSLSSNVNAQYFTKVINTPISTYTGDSRSINWIDVNNDGNVDLFISNGPSEGQNNVLFMNLGAGAFSAVTVDSIVLDNQPSDGASFADVDNDGSIDAAVVNWYNQDNLFYLNNGDGTFTKNNDEILSNDAGYSETASWADYDKDGLVDLYVTNSAGGKKNFLYHNEGNSNFSKIITGTMVNDAFFSRNVSWVDIDGDEDLDLFVTNENNQNENIYRNDGLGVFTKLTTGALLNDGGNTNSSSWADIDNDGDLDVFLANHTGFNALFKNDGSFNFTKITNDTVATTPAKSISSAWSDIDNDGDVDLFVTNAFGTTTKQLNYLYINDGSGNFSRNALDVVVNDSSWSYGCAFGDYDNDGFEDLAVATCRFESVDYANFLYHNNTNSNHWITLKLVGTLSNKSAIGAKVRIKTTINGVPTWQMREVSSQSSYNGQNDLRVHFGLKDATSIDSIRIEWPLGLVEDYTTISSDQFYEFVEGVGYTGLNEQNPTTNPILHVYPNPANDRIHIKLKNVELASGSTIKLINSQGSTIYTAKTTEIGSELSIDLNDLTIKEGLYFILLERKNEASMLTKVVITD